MATAKNEGKDGRQRRQIAAKGKRVENKMFTREEIDALVAALAELAAECLAAGNLAGARRYLTVQLLVRVAALTAARVSELLALCGRDVAADGPTAKVWLKRAKGSVSGYVWLANGVGAAMLAKAAEVGDDGVIFATGTGRAYRQSDLSRAMRDAVERAGIELGTRQTWHSARHHAAWREWERTKDLRRVQALLGHRSPHTTSVYLSLDERARDELVREATVGLEY